MRLLVLSDLHLELWREHAPHIDVVLSRPDVVVLAGDIDKGGRAVMWAAATFPGLPVIYVAGNHEYYGSTLEDTENEIREACLQHMNVHYLNCDEIVINNVRFLGATLWTDFKLFGDDTRFSAMIDSRAAMNDYKRIRRKSDYRKIHPSDTAHLHAQHRSWLNKKLSEPFGGPTVVVSHMAPSMQSVAPEYEADPVSAAYASRLDALVDKCALWVHGHMHARFDYPIGKGRVICNPLGYPKKDGAAENPDFDPHFIVEI
jgi:Icc-related predicted phosphoesterase